MFNLTNHNFQHKISHQEDIETRPKPRFISTNFIHVRVPTTNEPCNKIESNENGIFCEKKSSEKFYSNRSIGCQTIYRAQSAQTLPYLPDIRSCEKDEYAKIFSTPVINSKMLSRPKKLPSAIEQQQIENVENSEDANFIFTATEWAKWLAREQDIEEDQLQRHQKVKYMLGRRINTFIANSSMAVERELQRYIKSREKKHIEMK